MIIGTGGIYTASVTILFDSLSTAAEKARKACFSLRDYADQLHNAVISPIGQLPGNDNKGYASSASSLASEKAKSLRSKADSFYSLACQLDNFNEFAKDIDKKVESLIDRHVMAYVGRRNLFQQASDFIYEQYVTVTRLISDNCPVVKKLIDWMKQGYAILGNAVTAAYNFFKYGDGKYILNIVNSIVDVVLSVITIISIATLTLAVAAIPVFGPILATVGMMGLIAGSIAAVMKMGDMMATTDNNLKALSLSADKSGNEYGNIVQARFYGDIEGANDYIQKTDFGGKSINEGLAVAGLCYDEVRDGAEAVAETVDTFLNITNIARKIGAFEKDFSFTKLKENIKKEYIAKQTESGIEYDTNGNPTRINWYKATTMSAFESDYSKKFGINDWTMIFLDRVKQYDNIRDAIKSYDTAKDLVNGKYDPELEGKAGTFETFVEVAKTGSELANQVQFIDSNVFGKAISKLIGWVGEYTDWRKNGNEYYNNQQDIYRIYHMNSYGLGGNTYPTGGLSAGGFSDHGGGFRF